MNANVRKRVERIRGLIESYSYELEEIKDDEECKFDNLPENFQEGEQGERMQNWISALEDAMSYLDDAISSLEVD